jgi:hypothetical protein
MSDAQTKQAALTPASDTKPVAVEVKCPTADEVQISYAPSADQKAVTATALTVLREICSKACVKSVEITSTARDATDQVRIMHKMIKDKGAAYVNNLYGADGKKVVAVYEESEKNKLSEDDTKKAMLKKMNELGPSNVSHHIANGDGKLCVFDVAPSSVGDKEAMKRFVKESKAHAKVSTFFEPPRDPAFHLEVTN